MELQDFAGMDVQEQEATVATMDLNAVNNLRMAAERAGDVARHTTRDSATVGIMTYIAGLAAGESRRRFPATRTARRNTGCVAKCDGRWVSW